MAEDCALLAGQVQTRLSRGALASRLRAAGIRAEVRESGHYQGGRYVCVHEADGFTMERVASGEYLVHADADTMEPLHRAASLVSGALTGLGIRHRFELSQPHSDLYDYLHHLWPQGPDATT